MRQFIRHPTTIPITAEHAPTSPAPGTYPTQNVGVGGLAFISDQVFDIGNILHLSIPQLSPPFETVARVVWTHDLGASVETGVEFLSRDEAYRARMIEQVCHIEAYRHEVANNEGRSLSANEAAAEWIKKFATSFPVSDTELN